MIFIRAHWNRLGLHDCRPRTLKEYVTKGISHPVFQGDLVYKVRRIKCEANFVSSGSEIIKRLRRRKYDPVIEKTIGLVLGPFTTLYRSLCFKLIEIVILWVYFTIPVGFSLYLGTFGALIFNYF